MLTALPWPQDRQRAPDAGHSNRRCGDVTVARIPINAPVAEVRRVMRGGGTAIYLANVTYRGDDIHLEMDNP